jgi:hypothetical protein
MSADVTRPGCSVEAFTTAARVPTFMEGQQCVEREEHHHVVVHVNSSDG